MTQADFLQAPFPPATDLPELDTAGPGRFFNRELSWLDFNWRVLEEAEMEELGMGALLSVSRGSRQPAKLIIMEYMNGPKNQKPVIFVGKGLTFDAGGISIKG